MLLVTLLSSFEQRRMRKESYKISNNYAKMNKMDKQDKQDLNWQSLPGGHWAGAQITPKLKCKSMSATEFTVPI